MADAPMVTCRVGPLPADASRAAGITVRVNPGTTAPLTTRVPVDDIKGRDPVSGDNPGVAR